MVMFFSMPVYLTQKATVFPEWVRTGADGYKAVNFYGFEAVTIEAVKQLKTENDAQQSKIEQLTKQNQELEQRVAALEVSLAQKAA